MQHEELLNEQSHYSHHKDSLVSSSEVCHASSSDGESACHGKHWQGDLMDVKDEEEENFQDASLVRAVNDEEEDNVHSGPVDDSSSSVTNKLASRMRSKKCRFKFRLPNFFREYIASLEEDEDDALWVWEFWQQVWDQDALGQCLHGLDCVIRWPRSSYLQIQQANNLRR
ncbi:unnamed protein product [Prorocentrum cordatum]|uniref:Uncharacterized protein n=1 Tax=Prorocentrum cordatum TaxID=2364126 RepID=A0ABN9R7I9_9DINO|nr:unnamed protein product [Polarella glacialis]